jgi:hypothetical protein
MRTDSIQFSFASAVARARRNRRPSPLKHVAHQAEHVAVSAAVIDEAIAGLETDSATAKRAIDKTLMASLSAQLAALDQQREHLAGLLSAVAQ